LFGKYLSRIARDIRYLQNNEDVAVVSPEVVWRVSLAFEARAEFACGNVLDEAVGPGHKPKHWNCGMSPNGRNGPASRFCEFERRD
jgi:hypothetical protein